MARRVTLRFSGSAEQLLRDAKVDGKSEQDVIANALWLYSEALNGRLATIDHTGSIVNRIWVRRRESGKITVQPIVGGENATASKPSGGADY